MTNQALTASGQARAADLLGPALVESQLVPSHGLGKRNSELATLPRISPLVLRWFTWYSRRYFRRHFHCLRISRAGLPPRTAGRPLVLYSNHASWWDPLVCLLLKDMLFSGYTAFAPMDAHMLERYRFSAGLDFSEWSSARPAGQCGFCCSRKPLCGLPKTSSP